MRPNILIAVTAYGGSTSNETVKSLTRLQAALHANEIQFAHAHMDQSDISAVRNICAAFLLQHERLSHVLFVDYDAEFRAEAVLRMLEAQKPVIGCLYPRRDLDLAKAFDLARRGHSDAEAIALAYEFSSPVEGITGPGPVVEVKALAMGLTLIHRSVFEALTGKVSRLDLQGRNISGVTGIIHGFFDTQPGLSEDAAFCLRWTQLCAGKNFALIDEEIGHVGSFVYRARFSDRLLAKAV
jgi:hypothetical protein